MSSERPKGRRDLQARVLQNHEEVEPERRSWTNFCCRLQLKNERPFSIAPLFALVEKCGFCIFDFELDLGWCKLRKCLF